MLKLSPASYSAHITSSCLKKSFIKYYKNNGKEADSTEFYRFILMHYTF